MQITFDIPDNLTSEKVELLKTVVLNYLKMGQFTPDLKHESCDINRHAGKLRLTEEPLVFQQTMRDEWLWMVF